MQMADIALNRDVWEKLTNPKIKKLLNNEQCEISAIIVLGKLPKPDKSPVGDGYFFCL